MIVTRWIALGCIAVSIGTAAIGTAAIARAEPPAAPRPSPRAPAPLPDAPPARLPAVSGLTPAQRQSLEELHQKTYLQFRPLQAGLWLKNQELDALWASESASREKIFEKLSELDLIRGRMREILVAQRLAVIAVLTPEQRVSFRAQIAGVRAAPRSGPKSSVLGLEECMSTGDCAGGPPPGLKQR